MGAMWLFDRQRRFQFEACLRRPPQTITAILPGSKWSCSLLRIVRQDALCEVTKIYPLLKLGVFVDDITAFMNGRNEELVEKAENVLKNLKRGGGAGLEGDDD